MSAEPRTAALEAAATWLSEHRWCVTDWGDGTETGERSLSFRHCCACHGVDEDDYDRLVGLGRTGAAPHPNHHLRRGHEATCPIAGLDSTQLGTGSREESLPDTRRPGEEIAELRAGRGPDGGSDLQDG
jgi:hypothetical protein